MVCEWLQNRYKKWLLPPVTVRWIEINVMDSSFALNVKWWLLAYKWFSTMSIFQSARWCAVLNVKIVKVIRWIHWTELILDGVNCFKVAKYRRKIAHQIAREHKYIQLKPKFKWIWWKTMTVHFMTLWCIYFILFPSEIFFTMIFFSKLHSEVETKRANSDFNRKLNCYSIAIWPKCINSVYR